MLKTNLKKIVLLGAMLGVCGSASADISSNTVQMKEVRPLSGGTAIVIAVTPAADVCGGKTNFYIRNTDTHNGKAIYAAALTAMASGLGIRPQVASGDCGQVWPNLEGLLVVPASE